MADIQVTAAVDTITTTGITTITTTITTGIMIITTLDSRSVIRIMAAIMVGIPPITIHHIMLRIRTMVTHTMGIMAVATEPGEFTGPSDDPGSDWL